MSTTDLCDGDDGDEEEDVDEDCSECTNILEVSLEAHKAGLVNISKGEGVTEFCHFVQVSSVMHDQDGDDENTEDPNDGEDNMETQTDDYKANDKKCVKGGECSAKVSAICLKHLQCALVAVPSPIHHSRATLLVDNVLY